MKVQRVPLVVDAVIWDDTPDAFYEIRDLGLDFGGYHFDPPREHDPDNPRALVLHTSQGDRTAMPGDAVVRGVVGEFYPVQADLVWRLYRPLDAREGELMADVYAASYGTRVEAGAT